MSKKLKWTLGENKPNFSEDKNQKPDLSEVEGTEDREQRIAADALWSESTISGTF
jgi:hypothetical protein